MAVMAEEALTAYHRYCSIPQLKISTLTAPGHGMLDQYTPSALRVLQLGLFEAHRRAGVSVEPRDLLLAALQVPEIQRFLPARVADRRLASPENACSSPTAGSELPLSSAVVEIFQRVSERATSESRAVIEAEHLLRCVLEQGDTEVESLLSIKGVSTVELLERIDSGDA